MPVASFSYNHCFGANAVPWGLVGPNFRIFHSAPYTTPHETGYFASTQWCKRGTMGIGRAEFSHISIRGPIPPMKRGSLWPRSGKYCKCTD